jgi:hypothetical protein
MDIRDYIHIHGWIHMSTLPSRKRHSPRLSNSGSYHLHAVYYRFPLIRPIPRKFSSYNPNQDSYPEVEYSEVMSGDPALLKWLDEIVSSSFNQDVLGSSRPPSTNGVSASWKESLWILNQPKHFSNVLPLSDTLTTVIHSPRRLLSASTFLHKDILLMHQRRFLGFHIRLDIQGYCLHHGISRRTYR